MLSRFHGNLLFGFRSLIAPKRGFVLGMYQMCSWLVLATHYTLMATHYMLIFLVYKWNFLPVGVFLFLIDSRSKMLSKGICFPDSGTIHKDTKAIICHSKMIFSFMPT